MLCKERVYQDWAHRHSLASGSEFKVNYCYWTQTFSDIISLRTDSPIGEPDRKPEDGLSLSHVVLKYRARNYNTYLKLSKT